MSIFTVSSLYCTKMNFLNILHLIKVGGEPKSLHRLEEFFLGISRDPVLDVQNLGPNPRLIFKKKNKSNVIGGRPCVKSELL